MCVIEYRVLNTQCETSKNLLDLAWKKFREYNIECISTWVIQILQKKMALNYYFILQTDRGFTTSEPTPDQATENYQFDMEEADRILKMLWQDLN